MFGRYQFSLSTNLANVNSTLTWLPGEISFINANQGTTATTGTLRLKLWALPAAYSGSGSFTGFVLAEYTLRFSDGSSQMSNGQTAFINQQTLRAQNAPRGNYCIMQTLEEFNPQFCNTTSGFCVMDFLQYPNSQRFE
jgi:hypothetical protein